MLRNMSLLIAYSVHKGQRKVRKKMKAYKRNVCEHEKNI